MLKILKGLLLTTAILPLIFITNLLYPFVFGKALFLRAIIHLALLVFLMLLIRDPDLWKQIKQRLKSPIVLLVALFFVSAIISSLFAIDSYRAFWGSGERMEGLFMMLHYAAFFFMSVAIFNKKDWLNFLKISLLVSTVVAFFGWLQVLGVDKIPFAKVKARPDAFLGNTGYTSSYFLFILFSALIIRLQSLKKYFWYYFSSAVAAISLVMIIMSATRGVFVGLLAAAVLALFYWRKRVFRNRKRYMTGLILLAVILVGFMTTRSMPFWQNIPGVDKVASFSLDQATIQTRLIAAGVSWEAIKERPLFGWGLENYNIAYNKYFDPEYSLYENRWFDRSHNRVLDVAVMQGLLGLLIYLAIFIVTIYKLGKLDNRLGKLLIILLVAYFVQSLFWFDHLVAYLMLFAFLAFSAVLTRSEKDVDYQEQKSAQRVQSIAGLFLLLAGILFLYSTYVHFVIYRQAKLSTDIRSKITDAKLIDEKLKSAFEPYSFIQLEARGLFVDLLTNKGAFARKELNFIADKALAYQEDLIDKDPTNPISMIRLSEAYHQRAAINPEYHNKGEVLMRKASKLSPTRQEIYYRLAIHLASQKKKEEAVEVARYAVDLNPKVGRAQYVLGLILSIAGGHENRIEGEDLIAKALEMQGLFFVGVDANNLISIYSANIVYHAQRRDKDRVLSNAKQLRKVVKEYLPDKLERVDKIIRLAEDNDWLGLFRLLTQ